MQRIIFFCFISLFFSSCIERAYYVSPGYGNAMPYHTIPLRKDSIKSSLYLDASILAGGANDQLRDEQYAFNANLYNANSYKWFKLWYGGGFTLGDYKVKPYDSLAYDEPFAPYINSVAGWKFFGSLNQNGGIAFTIPLGKKSEWRILGIQTTLQEEFGNYLSFRKQLAKDSVPITGNTTSSFLATVGFSSEESFGLARGTISVLQQYSVLTGKSYRYFESYVEPMKLYRYYYFTNVFAVTVNRVTGYLETSIGNHMANVAFGLNYQLSARRK